MGLEFRVKPTQSGWIRFVGGASETRPGPDCVTTTPGLCLKQGRDPVIWVALYIYIYIYIHTYIHTHIHGLGFSCLGFKGLGV